MLSFCVFIVCLQSYVQGLHYAQVQHSTTGRPAAPISVKPVQYATVKNDKKPEPVQTPSGDVSLTDKFSLPMLKILLL